MNFIYSTISTSVDYAFYKNTDPRQLAVLEKSITIKGGANVMNKRDIYTPKGFITKVTDEELELLKSNPVFKMHVENGFISYEEKKEKSLEKKLEDMTLRDNSAPKDKKFFIDRRKEAEIRASQQGIPDEVYAPLPNK